MMKFLMTIVFNIFILTGFSQSNPDSSININSLKLFTKDTLKLSLRDSSFFTYATYLPSVGPRLVQIPNCAELVKNAGIYYLKSDTTAYCGYCAVLQNGEKHPVWYSQKSFYDLLSGDFEYKNFIYFDSSSVKIISHYVNGFRDGARQYFDVNGKLYKVEIYENGKLMSTKRIE